MPITKSKDLQVISLGPQNYQPVWELQRRLQHQRIEQMIPDTLLLVEHPHVYTIGKSGDSTHILKQSAELEEEGIEVIQVDRGGDVTYHGPGQLVGYPIFDLKQHQPTVTWYMWALEEVFIRLLAQWGIVAERAEGLRGVWVGREKIVALGVRIARWVTMHGFALNIRPNLLLYEGIIPCGITDRGVTSLEKIVQKPVEWPEVQHQVVARFAEVFEFESVEWLNPHPLLEELCALSETSLKSNS